MVTWVLLIVGGLNWGLEGAFNWGIGSFLSPGIAMAVYILVGLAVLQETLIEHTYKIMHSFDQVLVFSGNLGHHGGEADLGLLDKVQKIKEHHPGVEIAWDGGISDQNAKQLIDGGVDVLNVGGFIQKSETPQGAYDKLVAVIS